MMKQDIDVLAVFESGAEYPKPLRFKLFESGIKKAVAVGQIIETAHLGAGGASRIEYSCLSAGSSGNICYKLKCFYKTARWELEIGEDD